MHVRALPLHYHFTFGLSPPSFLPGSMFPGPMCDMLVFFSLFCIYFGAVQLWLLHLLIFPLLIGSTINPLSECDRPIVMVGDERNARNLRWPDKKNVEHSSPLSWREVEM